jgi:hypothetical protein
MERLRRDRELCRLQERLDALVGKVEWPAEPVAVVPLPRRPLRDPGGSDGIGHAGSWWSARLRREVGYDSQCELDFVQFLDAADNISSYCEQPQRIHYELDGRPRVYYPDFAVELRDGRRFLVEIKAFPSEFGLRENVVKFAAARGHCHARGWGFVALARNKAPSDVRARPVPHTQAQVLRDALATGPLSWVEVKTIMRDHDLAHLDIAALTLQHGWYWYLNPYQLSSTPHTPRWPALSSVMTQLISRPE